MITGAFQRRIVWALAVALALAVTPVRAAEDAAFVSGIDDLPLMEGLVEDRGGAMVFDSPAGRIVEVEASGRLSRPQVLDFYVATLPELGWQRQGETSFARQGEILKLEIAEQAGRVVVRFVVSPAER